MTGQTGRDTAAQRLVRAVLVASLLSLAAAAVTTMAAQKLGSLRVTRAAVVIPKPQGSMPGSSMATSARSTTRRLVSSAGSTTRSGSPGLNSSVYSSARRNKSWTTATSQWKAPAAQPMRHGTRARGSGSRSFGVLRSHAHNSPRVTIQKCEPRFSGSLHHAVIGAHQMTNLALNPRQEETIGQADARLNIWHGSVRSGKSYAKLIRFAAAISERERRRGDYVLISKTMRTMRRNVIGPLQDLLGPQAVRVRWGDGIATILGQPVELVSANDIRAEQKIRGGTFELVGGDEITLWPESLFRMVLSRMSVEGAQFFGCTNPDSPLHWLKKDYIDRAGELDLKAFHFVLRDNLALDPSFVEAIEKEYVGLWRKRFIDGLWVMAEGAIWDMLDPDTHCPDAVPGGTEFIRYFVGVDYGTSNPFVALLFGVGVDGRYWMLDEWRWDSRLRGGQLTDAQYSEKLAQWISEHGVVPAAWYVDPSAASFILQARQDHSWNVVEAENDVGDGLRVVGTVIGGDRLRVLRTRCERTLAELQSYAWDPRAQEKGEDKPIKADDHGPDACRYALFTHIRHDIGDPTDYGWA